MDLTILAICVTMAAMKQVSSLGASAAVDSDLRLTAWHQHIFCPEGANATLVCVEHGHHTGDTMHSGWLFNEHQDRHCQRGHFPRGGHNRHNNRTLPVSEVAEYAVEEQRIVLRLAQVRHKDQGRYCCLALEKPGHSNTHTLHSHILLTVGPRRDDSLVCTDISPTSSESKMTAGFATAACILAFLCLPLVLVLVYKQRQTAQANRRAHELVRMDSEAVGHDNPVFLAGSPNNKPRTVSQILSRQPSESGRHLLSDPGTPLSPACGDVFFPSQEPIPESPDFLQV